jgi:hypothetical protein
MPLPPRPAQGNTGDRRGGGSRSLARRATLAWTDGDRTSAEFSVLGLGRVLVTIRQTAGAPGAVAQLATNMQGQFFDIVDETTIAAIGQTYRLEVMSASSTIRVDLVQGQNGDIFDVVIQGAGTT